jgi:hypothetical protein
MFRVVIQRLPGAIAIDLSLVFKVAQGSGDEPVNGRGALHLCPVWRKLAGSLVSMLVLSTRQ